MKLNANAEMVKTVIQNVFLINLQQVIKLVWSLLTVVCFASKKLRIF